MSAPGFEAPVTGRGGPALSLGVLVTCLVAPSIMVEQSGNNNIFFGNTIGAPGNHSYYILFNDVKNSCIQFVYSYTDLFNYPSIHRISGLAAGGV